MGKDSRMSFRISKTLSDRIDIAIDKSAGQIRDRSEFGTKAIKYYLDYIENIKSEDEVILEAILALANHTKTKDLEITEIEQILEDRMMIPKVLASNKTPESHPDFGKIMGLMDMLKKSNERLFKDLATQLRDATYEDISLLYQKFSDKYFLSPSRKTQ